MDLGRNWNVHLVETHKSGSQSRKRDRGWNASDGCYGERCGGGGRAGLEQRIELLPKEARWVTQMLVAQLDFVMGQIEQMEKRLAELVRITPAMQWLKTLPGIGVILAATIELEIGQIGRFPSAPHFTSYAGTTPRVHASGGKVRCGRLRCDANQYLKWAFVEAANSVAVNHPRYAQRHVSQLYKRLAGPQGAQQGHLERSPATWPRPPFTCCPGNNPIEIPLPKRVAQRRCKRGAVMIPSSAGSLDECDTPPEYFSCPPEGEETTGYNPFRIRTRGVDKRAFRDDRKNCLLGNLIAVNHEQTETNFPEAGVSHSETSCY